MRTFEFYLLVLEHTPLYLALVVGTMLVYRLMFWRTVKSIFDPIYFFIIFTNAICTANVVFLSLLNEIRDYYALTYLLSELALIGGLLMFSRVQPALQPTPLRPLFIKRLDFGMLVTMALVVIANCIIYGQRGIPLLLESRNDASGGGSGFGFMIRLSQTATAVFLLFYYTKSKVTGQRNSLFHRAMFGLSIVFGVLSGFKAFFLFYLFAYFVTRGRSETYSFKRTALTVATGAVVVLGLFAVVLDTTDLGLVFPALMTRLLASGDVYYMAFANDTIDKLPPQGFFFQLFGSLLASFRLIEWEHAPLNYGYVLNEVVNKNDLLLGPTFRYNVLWLLLTESVVLTTILSFFLGAIIGLLNNALYRRLRLGFGSIAIAYFYYLSFLLILAPDHAISDMFLSLPILFVISFIIFLPMSFKKQPLITGEQA